MKRKENISGQQRIKNLLNDSFITTPKNYHLSAVEAQDFLNSSVTRVRQNYSEIIHVLTTVFKFDVSDLNALLLRFNQFAHQNQKNVCEIEDYFSSVTVLKKSSYVFFCSFINYINGFTTELSHITLVKFSKTKFDPQDRCVFIVHGHDDRLKKHLSSELKKNDYNPILLSEKNETGISLFDKFERHANKCVKAIILMTNDDCVLKDNEKYYQARPNVFIEIGYFLSILDHQDIIVICEKGNNTPSDINGISYIEYDSNLSELSKKVIKALEPNK